MAYTWRPDEEITADKLNKMQIDPLLKAVNNSGVRGGIESSALNSDTIACDIGTGAGRSVAAEITEHELGNIHYEYDDGNNRWAMRSGSPGVTGKVEGSTGELKWNCDDFTSKQVNWQKITTDKWGNVICSEQVIDGGTHSTKMWNPKTCEGGEIWRRMGTIEADCKYKLPEGKSALMTWKYKAVNENNAFILPVPRQDGWETPAVLNVCTDTEVAPRTSNSHWIQTAGPDTGASVPIQGVGELGGIFTYQAQDHNGNNVGIGLASGIEFYDSNTINCRNTDNPRPKSTTARVDFGTCAKHGFIQISNVNPKHPWQFELTGHLDIGSGGGGCFDPGTNWFNTQIEEGKIPYANVQWSVPGEGGGICSALYYPYARTAIDDMYIPKNKQDGIISSTSLRRLSAQYVDEVKWNEKDYGHYIGSIDQGEIGVSTALMYWPNDNGKLDYDSANQPLCKMQWNPNGGLITGIIQDHEGWPIIDTEGMIHLPKKEYMGNYFVAKADWTPIGQTAQKGVISCIHNCLPAEWHYIDAGNIYLAGAKFCQGSLKDFPGVIQSITMVDHGCKARICDGKIYIPKGDDICKANYYPGICSVTGTVQSIEWYNGSTIIDSGDIKLATARWANDMDDRTGGINNIDEVDCDTWIEDGAIHLATANDNEGSSQRTGLIRSISVDPGTGFICNGGIFIHVDAGTGVSPSICKANYNPLYPQFNKAGIISSVGWCDNYDHINQGSIFMATANWDKGTGGWNIPQRTGGIKGICWGVNRNQPAIDNGNLIMPVATYYPCAGLAPAGVKNRPGLIRGVYAHDYLLPAPYIDECGYLHLRA